MRKSTDCFLTLALTVPLIVQDLAYDFGGERGPPKLTPTLYEPSQTLCGEHTCSQQWNPIKLGCDGGPGLVLWESQKAVTNFGWGLGWGRAWS